MSIVWTLLRQVLRFGLYTGAYVLLISQLSLFDRGWCFFYLGFLLFLPLDMPVAVQLLLGFATGLTIDISDNTGGLHAAAAVLLTYLRPWVLRLLTPRDGYDAQDSVNIHQMGWQWFSVYLLLLVGLHHLAYFLLELGSFRHFGLTLVRILASFAFTCVALLIVQLEAPVISFAAGVVAVFVVGQEVD